MNPLAIMWASEQARKRELREMKKLAEEVREAQAKARPLFEAAEKLRRERMRQDGPRGFIMAQREYSK